MRKNWLQYGSVVFAAFLIIIILILFEKKPVASNAIYKAAWQGNALRIAEILKEKPEFVNILDKHKQTALHYAASEGHIDVTKVLLANGANVEAKREAGFTPLHDAIVRKQKEVAKLLIAHGGKIHDEMSMAYVDKETVQLLLELGADVNKRDKRNVSPLEQAAFHGNTGVMQLLLDNGAEVNARNQYGSTPLHTATSGGETNAAKLLIDNGAIIDAKDTYGKTPLWAAVYNGQFEVAKLLLAKGADVHVKFYGRTLLHEAASKPKPVKHRRWNLMPIPGGNVGSDDPRTIVKLLIDNGADVNAKDKELMGTTPLHEATSSGTIEVMEILLDNGANINARDDEGNTPIHMAISDNNIEKVKLLLDNNADFTQKSSYGTPFMFAKTLHRKEIIELLLAHQAKKDSTK